MKPISIFLMFLILIIHFSCKKPDEPVKQFKINENIDTIAYENMYGLVNIYSSVWCNGNIIYIASPLGFYQLNNNFNVIKETIIDRFFGSPFMYSSNDKQKILTIKSNYSDVSCGSLIEFFASNNNLIKLIDSTYNISSAVYYRNTDQIIYYSYGNPIGTNPGYYLLNKTTEEKQLLLEYMSEMGPSEFINGFDIHPTKDILIIPVVRMGKSPLIVEYNFNTKTADTLNINFDFSFNRICLWLRYNKTGEQILYSCYPRGAGGHTTNDDSEVGIIERSTITKRILDVNTFDETGRSVNICPNWSPDEKHIIYSSAPLIMPEGAKGRYGLYILKNVN